jgi:hypothetical protein
MGTYESSLATSSFLAVGKLLSNMNDAAMIITEIEYVELN